MKRARRVWTARTAGALLLSVGILLGAPAGEAAPIVVKLATVAPEGSLWHLITKDMAERWREASDGQVVVRIFPGGIAGDETDVIRKIRIGQLQAAAVTSGALHDIGPAAMALMIPMLYDSYEELDYVRERLAVDLETRMAERGFVVLSWGDAGWIRFFAQKPVVRPDDLRSRKLFVWAGDSTALDLYRRAGMNAVPLAVTDVLPGLQTGLIDAFDTTPLAALAFQWFAKAPHMTDLKWAPLVGATVIHRPTWERIPPGLRPALMTAAREAAAARQEEIRRLDQEAIAEMRKYDLRVVPVPPEAHAQWQASAEGVYPVIRGKLVPAEYFDRAVRLRDEYRRNRLAEDHRAGQQ
ncbi:MAG TPA: TRAP transporter substrate-binding protein DctP [Candidatus Methylomirabilis sp.]|nr:TRAP transporter substrate-binding protein DctP [Candidatus Methylomirabilis sp.]